MLKKPNKMTQPLLTPQTTTTDALNAFTNQFNIRYILSSQGIAYFIAQDLSLALELDKDDFKKNFVEGGLSNRPPSDRLADTNAYLENNSIRLLEQESLKQFKTAYVEQIGPLPDSLKFTSKLYICTLEVATNYILKNKKDIQKQLNSILLDATNKQVIQENLQTSSSLVNPHFTKEIDLQMALAFLSTCGNYRIRCEESIADITANKQKHRRLDLVNIKYSKGKKIVTIYELKVNSITLELLTENLNKHYLELARCHYKTPYVKLVYIAPNAPEQAAMDLLAYSPDVSIMLLKDFTSMLLKSAEKRHKSDSYFVKKLLPESYPVKQLMF
jgi:hypothetical protein